MEYYFNKTLNVSFDEAIKLIPEALKNEEFKVITLPCNVIVQELSKNHINVAAVNPIASMMALQNPALEGIVGEVTNKLQKVISHL